MRKNYFFILFNIAMSLLLIGAILSSRSDLLEVAIPNWVLPVISVTLLIGTAMSAFFFVQSHKRYQAVKAIETALMDLSSQDQTDENPLKNLQMVPVSSHTPASLAGWNKLIACIDDIGDQLQASASDTSMGQFLCSYDSQRLLGILDALPDGIILADTDGYILLANRSCEGLLSRPLSDFIGRSILDLVKNSDARKHFESLLDDKSQQSNKTFEVASQSDTDQTVLSIFCHKMEHNAEKGDILINIRDVSQQKIGESSREQFIAHVSHEFRSPLTNIRAYAETLLSDMVLDANTQKEAFNVINNETTRLIRLVNDVLDLSRMEAGALNLEKGEVIMDRLVRQCANDVKGTATEKQLSLQTNYHPKLPNIHADREKLAVVINNLLTNAIKYTPAGGTIFFETNTDDNFITIKVSDTGLGIAEEDLKHIFDRFYRVDRDETASITGTGLGLAITKEIVTLHGGSIDVSSELNNGTEFTVKLPIVLTGPALGPSQQAESK